MDSFLQKSKRNYNILPHGNKNYICTVTFYLIISANRKGFNIFQILFWNWFSSFPNPNKVK